MLLAGSRGVEMAVTHLHERRGAKVSTKPVAGLCGCRTGTQLTRHGPSGWHGA